MTNRSNALLPWYATRRSPSPEPQPFTTSRYEFSDPRRLEDNLDRPRYQPETGYFASEVRHEPWSQYPSSRRSQHPDHGYEHEAEDHIRPRQARYDSRGDDEYSVTRYAPRETFRFQTRQPQSYPDAIVFRGVGDRHPRSRVHYIEDNRSYQDHRYQSNLPPQPMRRLPSLLDRHASSPLSSGEHSPHDWASLAASPEQNPPRTVQSRLSSSSPLRTSSRTVRPIPPTSAPALDRARLEARSEDNAASLDEQRDRREETATATTTQVKKKRKPRICTVEGCEKLVVDRGVCIRHGGGKRCNVDGCNCRAQNRGLCWKHGGFTICKVDGCAKRAKSRGICWSHGGGTQCHVEDCEKIAVSRGRCWAHGGGKRCQIAHCQKPAALRTDNYCSEHYSQQRARADDGGTKAERQRASATGQYQHSDGDEYSAG